MSNKSEERIERIGKEIDALCNVDVNYQNVAGYLMKAAQEKIGGSMTAAAAKLLKNTLRKGDVALIVTGFPLLDWLLGSDCIAETDGPPGAAVLARGIDKGFDSIPIVASTASMAKYCQGACHGVGFVVTSITNVLRSKPSPNAFATSVIDFTTDQNLAKSAAEDLLRTLNPKVLIAIEQPGQNEKGVFHFAGGDAISPETIAKADVLFAEARSRGIPTIAIGDRGNELGMGTIKSTVRSFIPFGATCACPCRGGIAASSEVDLVVSASISNWGAYGIAAAIHALTDKPETFPSPQIVKAALDGCVSVGSVDGSTGNVESVEDGISSSITTGLLELMKSVIDWSKKTNP